MGDGEGTSHNNSPGARLAAARKKAGLSVKEAAERLHMNQQLLEALEEGKFEQLGVAVYARGHLKRYAELVSVPETEVLSAYDAWSGRQAAAPDLSEVITGAAVRSGTRRSVLTPVHAVIGAIVLVLVMVVWWAMRRPSHTPAAAHVEPAPAVVAEDPSATSPPATTPPVASDMPAPAASAPATASASAPATASASAPATASASAPATTAAASSSQVRLRLNFRQDSWIEINGADGKRLFHGMAQAGSHRDVAGAAPLRVFLGNPPGVTLEMNGNPVALTGNPKPRRFNLDEAGHVAVVPADSSDKGSAAQPRSD